MNNHSQADQERLLELLADRALFGLEDESQSELATLQAEHVEIQDDEMDSIVALLGASRPSMPPSAQLPDSLRHRILSVSQSQGTDQVGTDPLASSDAETPSAPTVDQSDNQTVGRTTDSRGRWRRRLVLIACTAATTLLAVSGFDALRGNSENKTSIAKQREQVIASAADVVQVAWTDTSKTDKVSGDVVWSDTQQKGFMTFKGLPINDPKLNQYQLWVFDKAQDAKFPIDGGVFDVVGNEVIVPIRNKIAVKNATMFAVTIEKPGGVVVSDRSRLPLLAEVVN